MLNWYRALMRSILARRKVDIRVPASVPLLLIWGGTCRKSSIAPQISVRMRERE